VITRMWCRLMGHKWVLIPGVTRGSDIVFECARCGDYDWRDDASGEGKVA